jgi:SCY1-like protein 2
VLKHDFLNLQKLRFPLILSVSKPVEDVKSAIFAETETITGTLGAVIESKVALDELEIKLGLIQLCEALNFVHSTAQQVHLNLSPNSIVICHPDWKLAGFAFAVLQKFANQHSAFYDTTPATSFGSDKSRAITSTIDITRPSLDYMAPEVVFLNSISPAADMFSLGCLIYELFWLSSSSSLSSLSNVSPNSPKKLINVMGNVDNYRRAVEDLVPLNMDHIPHGLRHSLESLLATDSNERPTAEDLLKTDYFNDTAVKILQYLSHVNEHDDRSKADFLKGLKVALGTMTFSTRLLETKILPPLLAELRNTILIPLILPNLFLIAEMLEKNANQTNPPKNGTFATMIYPAIAPLSVIAEPFQIVVILLQKLEFMSKRISEQAISRSLAPMACLALDHTNGAVVVLALKELLPLLPFFDHETIRASLSPRVLNLIHNPKTAQVMRVQALFTMSKLIPFAARQFIETSVLPSILQTISIDRSSTTLAGIAGVCDVISLKFGPEYTAHHILPSLLPLMVDVGLARKQFDTFLTIINGMIGRITEARNKAFDAAEARSSSAAVSNIHISDAERLEAFSAQLPPVASNMTSSASQLGLHSSTPVGRQSPAATTGTNNGNMRNGILASPIQTSSSTGSIPISSGQQVQTAVQLSNAMQTSNSAISIPSALSIAPQNFSQPEQHPTNQPQNAKAAAAFSAILLTQAQRRQAVQEQKDKTTLIDMDGGFQAASKTHQSLTPGPSAVLAPSPTTSAFGGGGGGSDIFSLDTSAFNMDSLLTPSTTTIIDSNSSSNNFLSNAGGSPALFGASSLFSQAAPLPTPFFDHVAEEDDDLFNPRAVAKAQSSNGLTLTSTTTLLTPSTEWLLPTSSVPNPSPNTSEFIF